jgi:hypothetical protein
MTVDRNDLNRLDIIFFKSNTNNNIFISNYHSLKSTTIHFNH